MAHRSFHTVSNRDSDHTKATCVPTPEASVSGLGHHLTVRTLTDAPLRGSCSPCLDRSRCGSVADKIHFAAIRTQAHRPRTPPRLASLTALYKGTLTCDRRDLRRQFQAVTGSSTFTVIKVGLLWPPHRDTRRAGKANLLGSFRCRPLSPCLPPVVKHWVMTSATVYRPTAGTAN